ncbi:unnamed protein product [Citrullus colocynthis]|uniref:Uncharacterized protein n=1 Tax=Citrullus colocynthis TaxID=252529 RepID=A0ABP0Y3A7_9ROSI
MQLRVKLVLSLSFYNPLLPQPPRVRSGCRSVVKPPSPFFSSVAVGAGEVSGGAGVGKVLRRAFNEVIAARSLLEGK